MEIDFQIIYPFLKTRLLAQGYLNFSLQQLDTDLLREEQPFAVLCCYLRKVEGARAAVPGCGLWATPFLVASTEYSRSCCVGLSLTSSPFFQTGKKSRSAAQTFCDSFIKADFYTEMSP